MQNVDIAAKPLVESEEAFLLKVVIHDSFLSSLEW